MYDTPEPEGDLRALFEGVRRMSEALARPLSPEDQTLQSMEAASPVKWNLAHTSWFFETFLLKPSLADYAEFHPQFAFLFNSYYQQVGPMHARARRGMLSRPTVEEVGAYRAHVDDAMRRLLDRPGQLCGEATDLIALGCAHEQQHQELLLTDLKHALFHNPLDPDPYSCAERNQQAPDLTWIEHAGGVAEIGYEGGGFSFDNEGPRHQALLQPFLIASRPATNGEFLAFIEQGGYRRSDLWLSDGWAEVCEKGLSHPLYWRKGAEGWSEYTLFGRRPVDPEAPLCHVSFYEACAFAEWSGARLPTEFEWESAFAAEPAAGQFLTNSGPEAPRFVDGGGEPVAVYGTVWEWTGSPYAPYPGYRAAPGAVGEYNGKFMCNQMVLRGGSCATPEGHIRPTYRNFFPPDAQWQYSGVRLAKDA
ncbi:MAG: ergothioneine biosynthesis protein EgtB [Pseudomonadota bacterium]